MSSVSKKPFFRIVVELCILECENAVFAESTRPKNDMVESWAKQS